MRGCYVVSLLSLAAPREIFTNIIRYWKCEYDPMSVIVGVFARHSSIGEQCNRASIMLDALSNRFCHGRTIEKNNDIAFGYGWLKTAINQETGVQTSKCGNLIIVGDIRLDNKSDLSHMLGLDQSFNSDHKIVLQAYLRWGELAPSYLKGDFAFAIWDRGKNSVFCARDKFGIRPFYYALDDKSLSFASDIPAFINTDRKGLEIDENAIAGFLVDLPKEQSHTSFRSLKQLPASHSLTVTKTRSDIRQYWQVKPSVTNYNPQELTERFLDLFIDAVKRRIPEQERVATMLSGGLDSSSITCVTHELSLKSKKFGVQSYSLVFPKDSGADETQYIVDIIDEGSIKNFRIGPDMPRPFDDLDEALREQTELYSAPTLSNMRQIYREVSEDGISLVLDGHGGDEVVSNGFGLLYQLAHSGKFIAL